MSCTLAASQGYSKIGGLWLVCELGLPVRGCREDFKSQCQTNLAHSGSSIWEPASPSPTLGKGSGRHSSGHAWGRPVCAQTMSCPGPSSLDGSSSRSSLLRRLPPWCRVRFALLVLGLVPVRRLLLRGLVPVANHCPGAGFHDLLAGGGSPYINVQPIQA